MYEAFRDRRNHAAAGWPPGGRHTRPSFSAGAFLIHDLDCKRGDCDFRSEAAQASAAPPTPAAPPSAAMKTRKVAGFGSGARRYLAPHLPGLHGLFFPIRLHVYISAAALAARHA